jgi:predicted NBD/HSP70 family sugar kinase
LGEQLTAELGLTMADLTQTVLGSPGVYDRRRDALSLAGALEEWDHPQLLPDLRDVFGPTLMIENDVDAAALAERAHGHGRDVESFAFVSVGTGVGMGLVLGGKLRRGAHGAAGEIAYLPLEQRNTDPEDARRRGPLEAAASAAGIVHAAQLAGLGNLNTARQVFEAAANGDRRAQRIIQREAGLVARAICSVVAVADPELIVLGGGIGTAAGLVDAVRAELERIAPVPVDLRVSALGADAVVDGCLASGLAQAWDLLTADGARDR